MAETDEKAIKKILPHSTEMEACVLGAIILDETDNAINVASSNLEPSDFYYPKNQKLFNAMLRLHAEKKVIDIMTVKEKCEELGYGEDVCALESIGTLVTMVPSSVYIEQYVEVVRDKSTLRQMIKTCEQVCKDIYSGNEETENLYSKIETDVFKFLQNRRGTGDGEDIGEIVMNAMDDLIGKIKNGNKVTGISTGFIDLDNVLTGLHGSELILVAARPAMGKTAFVLNIAAHACFHDNKRVAVFSLEMGKEQLLYRMIASEAMVDSQKMRTGQIEGSDVDKVTEVANRIAVSPIMLDDTPGITVADIRSKCRRMQQLNGGVDLIIIDYLQLMTGGKRTESRQQEVADISRSLKALAKELNVPIIALSQLNRAADARDDHKPRMSDLRESGSIEQDADVVMFIYRDEYYNKETTTKPGIADIIVAKQRSGQTKDVELCWMGQYTKFHNLDKGNRRQKQEDGEGGQE